MKKNNKVDDVNFILELFNVCLLFNSGIKLQKWDDEYYKSISLKVKNFKPIICQFFSRINSTNIEFYYLEVSSNYIDDFWEVFVKCRVFENIDHCTFERFLIEQKVSLHHILRQKKLVEYFDLEISNYMEKVDKTAEILISHRLVKKEQNNFKYHIPKSLSVEKQMNIIETYIESEKSNPNYLEILYKTRNTSEFPITDMIRLKAKKQYQEWVKNISVIESGFKFGATVGFGNIDQVVEVCNENPLNPKLIYSIDWLENNLDNLTLLNNFIYLFEYTDLFYRFTFPSKNNELSFFEKFGSKGNREYKTGIYFLVKEIISNLQIKVYSNELIKLGKRLEDIMKWFFEEYLSDEFKAYDFILSIPSVESSYLEKVRSMFAELDSVLRQFTALLNTRKLIEN